MNVKGCSTVLDKKLVWHVDREPAYSSYVDALFSVSRRLYTCLHFPGPQFVAKDTSKQLKLSPYHICCQRDCVRTNGLPYCAIRFATSLKSPPKWLGQGDERLNTHRLRYSTDAPVPEAKFGTGAVVWDENVTPLAPFSPYPGPGSFATSMILSVLES